MLAPGLCTAGSLPPGVSTVVTVNQGEAVYTYIGVGVRGKDILFCHPCFCFPCSGVEANPAFLPFHAGCCGWALFTPKSENGDMLQKTAGLAGSCHPDWAHRVLKPDPVT